jgi:hypothetical protein
MILIILFYLFSIYLNSEYQLKFNLLFSVEYSFDLYFINKEANNNFFYSGRIENIKEVLDINEKAKEKSYKIKDGNHPLVFILDEKYISNISLFPTDTIFIIEEGIALCINNEYNNYTLFAIVNYQDWYYLELTRNYYITIGKKMDDTMNNFLSILVVFSILASILSVYIMNRIIKRIDQDNILNIHALIVIILYILMVMNASIGISFLIFKDKSYMFSTEYVTILMYSLYKSVFFTTMFIILLGHGTITFDEWGTLFKKLNKKILSKASS